MQTARNAFAAYYHVTGMGADDFNAVRLRRLDASSQQLFAPPNGYAQDRSPNY